MIILITVIIILFFMGASMGSFLNALSYRIYNHKDFVLSRSRCDSCGHELGIWDLVPVISYLVLKGKCKYCGTKLSIEYLLTEITLGILYVLSFLVIKDLVLVSPTQFYLYLISLLFNVSFFFFIALYDLKYYIIPDLAVYTLSGFYVILIALIFVLHKFGINLLQYTDYNYFIFSHYLTAIILFLFFMLIYLFVGS